MLASSRTWTATSLQAIAPVIADFASVAFDVFLIRVGALWHLPPELIVNFRPNGFVKRRRESRSKVKWLSTNYASLHVGNEKVVFELVSILTSIFGIGRIIIR
jgi:hypothetical protein